MLLLEDWVQIKFKIDTIAEIVGAVIGVLALIVLGIICLIALIKDR